MPACGDAFLPPLRGERFCAGRSGGSARRLASPPANFWRPSGPDNPNAVEVCIKLSPQPTGSPFTAPAAPPHPPNLPASCPYTCASGGSMCSPRRCIPSSTAKQARSEASIRASSPFFSARAAKYPVLLRPSCPLAPVLSSCARPFGPEGPTDSALSFIRKSAAQQPCGAKPPWTAPTRWSFPLWRLVAGGARPFASASAPPAPPRLAPLRSPAKRRQVGFRKAGTSSRTPGRLRRRLPYKPRDSAHGSQAAVGAGVTMPQSGQVSAAKYPVLLRLPQSSCAFRTAAPLSPPQADAVNGAAARKITAPSSSHCLSMCSDRRLCQRTR